jgi:LL-diaminopimelate aminotransferase
MNIRPAKRIANIGSYAFADIDNLVEQLRKSGVTPIDFGVGDPKDPPFPSVITETVRYLYQQLCSGYPSYIGHPHFRQKVAAYMEKRFGVVIDPNSEVISSLGSKEMVFNFHEGFVNPGDLVIVPNPAYPPYIRGTLFAEGKPYFVNLLEENRFLPDLDAIPASVWDRAAIIWVNYPNNPTTAFAPPEFYEKLIHYAHKHNVIVGSDEAYIENYGDHKPRSILEFTRKGVVAVFSFSKMANMTMFRAGFVCGDPDIIDVLKKLKTNIDSGTPTFIQLGALAALEDSGAQQQLRKNHAAKLAVLQQALTAQGFPEGYADGTIYLWQKCPQGRTGIELARRFLLPDLGIVVSPGQSFTSEVDGRDPGEQFVRFALTPTLEQVEEAARRLSKVTDLSA